MIKGRDFVVFSDTLGDLPSSAFHLFKYIARDNRVFWFNTLCRMPKLARLDFWKVGRTVWSWLSFRRARPGFGRTIGHPSGFACSGAPVRAIFSEHQSIITSAEFLPVARSS